jgi:rhamnosyltransferase
MIENLISFIIRTKNEEKDIDNVIKSIRKQKTDLLIEIILVDSGSIDRTVDIAKPNIDHLVTIKETEFTWGKALNKGICISKGAYICLLSGHCIISNITGLDKTINLLKENDISAIYGRQVGDIKKDFFEYVDLEIDYPKLDYYEFGLKELIHGKSIGISNACCILKRESWIAIKYDENTPSAEDGIWAKEICNYGKRLAYSSFFEVYHGHYFDISYIYRKWYWMIFICIFSIFPTSPIWKKISIYSSLS